MLAGFLWAVAYAALGVLSGGIFDSPLLATLLATVLVLLVGGALNLVGARRRSAARDDVDGPRTDGGPAVHEGVAEPQTSGCERP